MPGFGIGRAPAIRLSARLGSLDQGPGADQVHLGDLFLDVSDTLPGLFLRLIYKILHFLLTSPQGLAILL